MPFQTRINRDLPIGVEGDFASANPRASVLAGEGGLVAGPGGVIVGNFAWLLPDGKTVVSHGVGAVPPTGFVHREENALIVDYLGTSSMVIPEGFEMTLFDEGDFLDKIVGGSASTYGAACYASFADGSLSIGAAPAGTTATGSVGATFTATGTGTSLAVTAVTGIISPGDMIAGTGVPAGTTIISGPANGGAGTYVTSAATTAAAATVTSFGNVLNVTAAAGVLKIGDALTGTGIPAGATLAGQVSGAIGGVGIYTLSAPATAYAASTALTVVGGILTKFVAKSQAAVGELVTISTWGN